MSREIARRFFAPFSVTSTTSLKIRCRFLTLNSLNQNPTRHCFRECNAICVDLYVLFFAFIDEKQKICFVVLKKNCLLEMNPNNNPMDGGGGNRQQQQQQQSGPSVQHNLTTIQMQGVQTVQGIVQGNVQTIQSVRNVIGTVGAPGTLVGKSISLDINPKLPLFKPVAHTGASSMETSKITTTVKFSISPIIYFLQSHSCVQKENKKKKRSSKCLLGCLFIL